MSFPSCHQPCTGELIKNISLFVAKYATTNIHTEARECAKGFCVGEMRNWTVNWVNRNAGEIRRTVGKTKFLRSGVDEGWVGISALQEHEVFRFRAVTAERTTLCL